MIFKITTNYYSLKKGDVITSSGGDKLLVLKVYKSRWWKDLINWFGFNINWFYGIKVRQYVKN